MFFPTHLPFLISNINNIAAIMKLTRSTLLFALAIISSTSAYHLTFESYLPGQPDCCRIHFDNIGGCNGNFASDVDEPFLLPSDSVSQDLGSPNN